MFSATSPDHGSFSSSSMPSWGEVWRSRYSTFRSISDAVSISTGVSARDLYKQVLLHLPRFSRDALSDSLLIRAEAERLAGRLLLKRQSFQAWTSRPAIPYLDKSNLFVCPCDLKIAQDICDRFHYIGSFREAMFHLGLYAPSVDRVPMALVSLSRMDIRNLEWLFGPPAQDSKVLVLSRLFVFDWAPRNTVSFFLARVNTWIKRHMPKVDTLVTYVNPNLGFSGASFLASNWKPLLETGVRYLYLNQNYITYRTFVALSPSLQEHVCSSRYPLDPLKLLKYSIGG